MRPVRVRFAPSPTGPLHIGGVRTALYNYLFAKQYEGTFILRIEDTDQTRFVPGAEEYIREALSWCGIPPDEGVVAGGEYAPYRQSERKEVYQKYAQQLLDGGFAYYAFDTSEELNEMRERLQAEGKNAQYDATSRMSMKNSLTLSEGEIKEHLNSGAPYVVRVKTPEDEDIRLNDLVRGDVTVHSSTLDDKVLLKSDGLPTYHLANVVDDYLMKISHVIRGEEWLPSAPLHVLLYHYLGWEEKMPQFAHLPLLMNPDGKGKLSKRSGDRFGFPVYPFDWKSPESDEVSPGFREAGYLPEATVNFLALLGWHPGNEEELFSLEELVQAFGLDRVSKAGAKFDIEKAKWFNQQYLKEMPDSALAEYLLKDLSENGIESSPEKAEQVCGLMKERVTFPQEIWSTARYFYQPPEQYDEKMVRKKWKPEASDALLAYTKILEKSDGRLSAESAKEQLQKLLEDRQVGLGKVMPALRLALTGQGGGPDLMSTMEVLGRNDVISRIRKAVDHLDRNN
ncbi:glutamate--tRNA ligase [Tunicatimonas pelagia]|uniref:glutamate--tRNA ligase n=1 Tax=Tunicatimonas pelagia TaxID=931531 RepID=UPI0026659F34|nr:glutamate--tRNA ligase [Tunicatimonas pelagia]WKN45898.1 glutamate--tRNA ligase [Tunicatimonas pelagia]